MKIIIAVLIFSAVVLFHELGHFLLAKKNRIVVTEFSLGMGPRLISRQIGETRYSVKALPFGGSCAMLGEDTSEEEFPGSFNAASVWARISVVAAGPVFNFLFAFVLAVVLVAFAGYDPAEIVEIQPGSAAEAAGLQAGDVITEFQGYHIDLAKDLYLYTYLNKVTEEPVSLSVDRNGESYNFTYTPDVLTRYLLGFNRSDYTSMRVESLIPGMPLEDAGVLPGDVITSINGHYVADGEEYQAYIKEHPLSSEPVKITYEHNGLEYDATLTPMEYKTPQIGFTYNVGYTDAEGSDIFKYGFLEVKYMIRSTIIGLKEFVTGKLGVQELSGPVGVVDVIGDTYEESRSYGVLITWMNMLRLVLLLSSNLGVMNLLPFPALDGGRLVFLFLEAIRRRPVNREVEGMVHFAGIMALMLLMVVVMYNDILKIF